MIARTEILLIILLCIVVYVVLRLRPQRADALASTNLARLRRIKVASRIFQWLIWISLLGGGYIYLAFLFGWPAPYYDRVRIVVSHSHIYTAPAEMPGDIYWLVLVRTGLAFFGAGVLLRLFGLFHQGILFSARNVMCIRFLGYWLIVDWLINYQLQSSLRDMDLSMNPVFVGLLVIFIAWIMDEARTLREEQELTV